MAEVPLSSPDQRRVALVTGGGIRVGAAIARTLAAAGTDLIVHYGHSDAAARAVVDEATRLGRRATAIQADLRDRAAIQRLADEALAWSSGRLDLLVHNAANYEQVAPEALGPQAWENAMSLNAEAPYLLTLALRSALRDARGSVVAIVCLSAERPWREYVPYSVSKAALAHVVRGLGLALAPEVRVNGIAPGAVLLPEGLSAEQQQQALSRVPLGRLGSPEDVARAVVFLAENDFITGQILAVDGGESLV
ncbi:SDR family oxidoreductase [Chondromyces apiculatus]|uniref:FolM Alternative dihydrofolate reductase 1 n=1 Tax=Chondromyces apiculatus DSM 436 TaxID=1192034 RepID=A0A017T6U0_9BACT|nr:SDR family oxidoreductase [Chondromyces apiculatus]EYF04973.1 FolM Alternative dihydrofolate reductase 1 [Chondromyces apiculatus DSM 436]